MPIDRPGGIYLSYISSVRCSVTTAKIFWTGRSQAVRLPKDFRFNADEVRIRRHGHAVILEPVAEGWSWLTAVQGDLDDDFVAAMDEEVPAQERPSLDALK